MAIIQAIDYNTVQSKLALVLGTGAGDFGYGQTVASSQVAQNSSITAQQWINLRNDLIKARQHQTGNDESSTIFPPQQGALVSQSILNACNTVATQITTDRLTIPPSSQATLETIATAQRTTSWNGTISNVFTVTFSDDNSARHFFNTGGQLQFTASRTGGNSGSKNNTWSTMFTTMGTIIFGFTSTTATGSGNNSSYGWSNLPGSNTRIFDKPAPAGVYAENEYYIYGRKVSNSQLEFTIQFQDNDLGDHNSGLDTGLGPYGTAVDEDVDGTLTSTLQARRASGANVTIPAPPATSSGL
jgi:hypothetical protein